MVVTNEPGVYFEGEFGVRLENILVVQPAESTEFGDFYQFETVTLCPFDLQLIDANLLTPAEIAWLNSYHQTVFEQLAPTLSVLETAWLANHTRPLKPNQTS